MKKIFCLLALFFIFCLFIAGCNNQTSTDFPESDKTEELQKDDSTTTSPAPVVKEAETVTCSNEKASISLKLPEGWAYDIEKRPPESSVASEFSMDIYPANNVEEKLSVSYFTTFGVCGTGLVQDEIKLGGYDARRGTYDEKSVWDFIVIPSTKGDFVILNHCSAEWWKNHGTEVMNILESASFTEVTETSGYTISINEQDRTRIINSVEGWYESGKTITVVVGTVTETNLYLCVNDKKLSPADTTLEYTTFVFEMPDCDVILKFEEESVDIPLPPEEKNERPNIPKNTDLEEANNVSVTDFALRLFKESLEDEKNTLISPLSVLTALSMTANGADGDTLSQMESVLGMPISSLNEWIKIYIESLPEEERYKLSLANSIWFKDSDSFEVNADFLKTNEEYYGAGIFKKPFDTSTLKEINAWVEENTNGMIKNILDSISKDAVMYLINALAFDAEWQKMYNEHQIREGEFTAEDGTKQKVELMYSEEYKYLEDENATGFIKYYADRKYAFAALLPKKGVSVSEYVSSLDTEKLIAIFENAQNTDVIAALPKFETEYKVEMSDILKNMGMSNAFNSTLADFSKLGHSTQGNIYISRVIHQTYIKVDGKGTKAGAATVIEVAEGEPMEIVPPKEVILDRPFVYMLIDCETNIPFFIGTLMSVE